MILAVTITFWTILVICILNAIAYMFDSYQKGLPVWARILNILWNIWLVFVMFLSLGII